MFLDNPILFQLRKRLYLRLVRLFVHILKKAALRYMEIIVDQIIAEVKNSREPKGQIVVGVFLRKILSTPAVEFMIVAVEPQRAVA